jgi:diguanylate cyclase (GGDEF)-like protein/PAS domain S-box-containing protein
MSVPVRALLVDDAASSSALLSEELRRGGFEPEIRRTTTREDFQSALELGNWDVVFSDISSAGLSAFDALAALKEKDLDVPFLIVSETLGEETVVRAMKAGAQNCIPRAGLLRLCTILERELREAQIRRERRQAQKALSESELRFRGLAESAFWVGTMLFANGAAELLFGYPVAALIGQPVTSLIPEYRPQRPQTAGGEAARTAAQGLDAGGQAIDLELVYGDLVRDGRRLVTVFARGHGDAAPAEEALTRRQIEEALKVSEKRYRALFERNLAGVYRSTTDGRLLDCNESFARIFGYASREEVLRQDAWNFYVKPGDREAALAKLVERQSLTNYELCMRRKDGSQVWVLQNENLVEGPDGRLSVIEGTTIDISERKRAEEQVKHLAFHDPLTNLPNRLLFSDRLTLAVAQAHRHNQRLAVLFLDLDRFKVINDSLGHSVGDELLRQVAERIQEYVREGDTVARLGGDEFTLLVPGISAEEDAAKIARKICEAIHDPFWIDGRELFVTTSVGVAVYPSDGHDGESLVRNADSAMYRAKDQGRDNYQLYTPAMNAKAVERLSLESRLRQAVANDELELHFQPFIDLRTAEVLGAEALIRWRHPELGLIPPMDFIPIAELSGLIVPIGEWVLRTACAEARKWHKKGFPGLAVSVNLSSRQFQQTDLLSQVTHALEESGLEADKLDLEITESNAMQNAEHSINTLRGLKKQGVRISMDDFGTGYSSLNYLKRFPIDRIKLDQSFVRDLPSDKDDAAIAMAVIAMGRSLELIVIAEGVETEEQLAFLKGHDCDQLQGFLLSRPLTPEAFDRFLDDSLDPVSTRERSRFARAH